MTVVIIAIIILGILGVLFGIGLAVASKVFAVEIDPRVEKITEALPGANCGACGNPGCSGFAEAVVSGKCEITDCPVCSSEARAKLAEILGRTVSEKEREVAIIHCQKETIEPRFEYQGIKDCASALLVNGGFTTCQYGCLGLGSCVAVCPFGAIYMGADGLPHVLDEKCTGCGACVRTCPRKIISLAPVSRDVHVLCNSKHNGKFTMGCCKHGCIGCMKCVKTCPYSAITVANFLASIDYAKCKNCGACMEVCPTGAIGDISPIRHKEPAKSRFVVPAQQEGL